MGLPSLEPESSPEWLRRAGAVGGVGAFGGGGIEPDELELELIAGNGGRRGEMGEPRSVNGFESGLSASKETTALNRSASPAGSPEGFWILPERDILERHSADQIGGGGGEWGLAVM